jgi:hypothetical protein
MLQDIAQVGQENELFGFQLSKSKGGNQYYQGRIVLVH